MADTLDPLSPSVNNSTQRMGVMHKLRWGFSRAVPLSRSNGEGKNSYKHSDCINFELKMIQLVVCTNSALKNLSLNHLNKPEHSVKENMVMKPTWHDVN